MVSKLTKSAKHGRSLLHMKHNLQSSLIPYHYHGMFTINRQFLLHSQVTFSLSSRLGFQSQPTPVMVSHSQRFSSGYQSFGEDEDDGETVVEQRSEKVSSIDEEA